MTENQISAVIGASAVLAGAVLGQGLQWLRERGARSSAARTARADRLRRLYTEVLTAAIQATPAALQYRPSHGPAVLAPDSADRLRAQLSLEAKEDVDAVLTAFIGVVNFSSQYEGVAEERKDHPERVPFKEVKATEKFVRDNMTKLEEACRQRLSELTK